MNVCKLVLVDLPLCLMCFLIYYLFSCSYMMSNGYKPSPLDLSDIKLTPGQELLVDKLAENAHNVWAKDRIKQGWTYGIQQVHRMCSCTVFQDQNELLKSMHDSHSGLSFTFKCN